MRQAQPELRQLVIGQVIAGLRKQSRKSQEEFADEIGVSQPTLSRIERGKAVPDILLFVEIADALDMEASDLHDAIDDAVRRTRDAAAGATNQTSGSDTVWSAALKVAGVVGVAGLVAFAVAAALKAIDEDDDDA